MERPHYSGNCSSDSLLDVQAQLYQLSADERLLRGKNIGGHSENADPAEEQLEKCS